MSRGFIVGFSLIAIAVCSILWQQFFGKQLVPATDPTVTPIDLSEIVENQYAIQTQLVVMDYTVTPKPSATSLPTETPYPAYPVEDATPNGLYALYAEPVNIPPAPDIETTPVYSDCSEINTPKVGFTVCRAPTLTPNEGMGP